MISWRKWLQDVPDYFQEFMMVNLDFMIAAGSSLWQPDLHNGICIFMMTAGSFLNHFLI